MNTGSEIFNNEYDEYIGLTQEEVEIELQKALIELEVEVTKVKEVLMNPSKVGDEDLVCMRNELEKYELYKKEVISMLNGLHK